MRHALIAALFLLSACATLGGGSITGETWRLAQLEGKTVTSGANIVLYADDNRVTGSGGCNRLVGSFTGGADGKVSFPRVASTRMMCLNGTAEPERIFLEALSKTDSYTVKDKRLSLIGNGEVLAVMTAE